MRKILWVALTLVILLIAVGSVAMASSNNALSAFLSKSSPVPQPNQVPLQSKDIGRPETLSETVFPQAGLSAPEVSVALSTSPPETTTDCYTGWYPCENGTMLCYGYGCPSFACGACSCSGNIGQQTPGCTNCVGWTWDSVMGGSTCVCYGTSGPMGGGCYGGCAKKYDNPGSVCGSCDPASYTDNLGRIVTRLGWAWHPEYTVPSYTCDCEDSWGNNFWCPSDGGRYTCNATHACDP